MLKFIVKDQCGMKYRLNPNVLYLGVKTSRLEC